MWQLMISREYSFGSLAKKRKETRFSLIGAPLDETNSFYPGTRFAPSSVRRVAESLEWYSFYSETDFSIHGLYDEGDIVMSPGRIRENIDVLGEALHDLVSERRIPVMLGGEHTVTLAASRILDDNTILIVFDAHLDLRDDYLGSRLNHATVLRRVLEDHKPSNIVYIGTRAVDTEELEYARKMDIKYITSRRVWVYGPADALRIAKNLSKGFDKTYISIDMDALDPGYAPGVGTPEPAGLDPWSFLEILLGLVDERMIGFDIVEVNPLRDCGDATSALAAKTVMEVISRYCIATRKC